MTVPLAIAVLFFLPKMEAGSESVRLFINKIPLINAIINATTVILLVLAFLAIKKKNIQLHKRMMTAALSLSVVFLMFYVSYHSTTESTRFPEGAPMRGLYLFLLLTHILLSAAVVPLVLISYTRALAERFDKHKKIARITLPVWLYVSITGVLVYLMISPYYSF